MDKSDIWSKRFSAWGAMFVTTATFLALFVGLVITSRTDPATFNNLMETVKALVMVCAGYWVGSSNSSQKKDEALANSSPIKIGNAENIETISTKERSNEGN